MTRQKKDGRYALFVEYTANTAIGAVMLGTSHTESVSFPVSSLAILPLSGPHTIPTVMYIKAKLITRFHPETRIVYLEADDHLFFNGPSYNLEGLSPVEKRNHKIFEWGGTFIDGDDEAKTIFGDVAPVASNPLLLLSSDVKPVVIKRIVANLLQQKTSVSVPATLDISAACNPALYPDDPGLQQESDWSLRPLQDKNRVISQVIEQHNLHLPGPLDTQMTLYFEKTIKVLKDHHIDVVLVNYPETAEFVARKNPQGQQAHEVFLQTLTNRYGLRRLDMRFLSSQGDRFFADQDHVATTNSAPNPSTYIARLIMQDFCFSQTGVRL